MLPRAGIPTVSFTYGQLFLLSVPRVRVCRSNLPTVSACCLDEVSLGWKGSSIPCSAHAPRGDTVPPELSSSKHTPVHSHWEASLCATRIRCLSDPTHSNILPGGSRSIGNLPPIYCRSQSSSCSPCSSAGALLTGDLITIKSGGFSLVLSPALGSEVHCHECSQLIQLEVPGSF